MRRLVLVPLALTFAVLVTAAWGQRPNGIPLVGVLTGAAGPDDPIVEAFRLGLRELGYVEGNNIRLEFRTAQGDPERLPGLGEELVLLRPDAIVTTSTLAAQAVKRATSTIPIVMGIAADPVGAGLVTNLSHPGANITGHSVMSAELSAKRLQLLKETIPRLARVAVLWNPLRPTMPLQTQMVDDLKMAAPSLSIELSFVNVRTSRGFDAAFSTLGRAHTQAVYFLSDPLFYAHRRTLAKLLLTARLPAIYETRAFADDGGLMSYGVNFVEQMRTSARYVDKILKGAKPGDLPIEQPTKFELVINLKTAKALGVTIPQSILSRADEVIR